jgi:hypothetical protein
VPAFVDAKKDAARVLRNAYEHIEDRALGQVNKKPHPQALAIFDYEPLLKEGLLVYGEHRLGVPDDVPRLLAEMRRFIREVAQLAGIAADQTPGASQNRCP